MKISFFIFNFWPGIEKCHQLPILLRTSIGAAKITHNESFKDNCSIAIYIAIVPFRSISLISTFLNISSKPKGILHHLCKFYTVCTECKGCFVLILQVCFSSIWHLQSCNILLRLFDVLAHFPLKLVSAIF